MNCESVLDSDVNDYLTILSDKIVRARKPHICGECGGEIPIGTEYRYERVVYDGHTSTHKTCPYCNLIRERMCCSFIYGQIPVSVWIKRHLALGGNMKLNRKIENEELCREGEEMKWTRKRPTEPGWYWRRGAHSHAKRPSIVFIRDYCGTLCITNWEPTWENWEWAGPISEPEE